MRSASTPGGGRPPQTTTWVTPKPWRLSRSVLAKAPQDATNMSSSCPKFGNNIGKILLQLVRAWAHADLGTGLALRKDDIDGYNRQPMCAKRIVIAHAIADHTIDWIASKTADNAILKIDN